MDEVRVYHCVGRAFETRFDNIPTRFADPWRSVNTHLSMSSLDGIFILTIALLAFWGFRTGVFGTAIWLVAALGTIFLSAQIVSRVIPLLGLPNNYFSIATSFAYVLFSAAVFTIARWISTSVRLVIDFTPLKWINGIGGALLGAVMGLLVVAAMIAGLAVFTYVVPEGSLEFGGVSYADSYSGIYISHPPRSWLHDQLTHSIVVEAFSLLPAFILPFAPREIGIAVEVLFSNVR